jgi:hypothetical protein
MLYKTLSAAVYGVDANIIEVEVDVAANKVRKTTSTPSDCRTPPCAKAAIACARR